MLYRSNIVEILPLEGGHYRLGVVTTMTKNDFSKIVKLLNKDFEIDIEFNEVGEQDVSQ